MILFLHGPDTYRSKQRLRFYREGFKKKYDPSGFNVIQLDGATLTMEQFRQHVGQAGFLSPKRFVSVENVIARNKRKKIQDEIVAYLDDEWSDENVIVFLEETATSSYGGKKKRGAVGAGPLFARLQKEQAEEFSLLHGEQLNKWIQAEVKQRGGTIAPPAVLELASLVGSDLWNMSGEIEKLIHYKNGGSITAEDVRQTVRATFDENIFHLTDALAAKNASLSLKLLHDQIQSGSHELYILTMLIRQFRILLRTRELIDAEPNYHTVAVRLKLHPFVAQKAIRDARQFTIIELKKIFQELLEIDIKLKSSGDNPRLLFDLLVTRVCGLA